jgi:hypothetical protein
VGFGTKRAAVDEDEGACAAGIVGGCAFCGVEATRANRRAVMKAMEEEREVRLPVLLLVMCQGHDWKMVVAEAVVKYGREDFKGRYSEGFEFGIDGYDFKDLSAGGGCKEVGEAGA